MENDIQQLRRRVEKHVGHKLYLPRDFDMLSELIYDNTGEQVSGSTLRRLWGINSEGVQARRYTLDVVARFIGCRDYNEFCGISSPSSITLPSNPAIGESVESGKLRIGTRLRLTWKPGRECIVTYLGRARYRIEEARSTHLHVGDTFTCHFFINGEPAYLNNVKGLEAHCEVYTIGGQGGISVFRLKS